MDRRRAGAPVNAIPLLVLAVAAQPLTLEHGEARWTVPGDGASALLLPLIEACPAPRN